MLVEENGHFLHNHCIRATRLSHSIKDIFFSFYFHNLRTGATLMIFWEKKEDIRVLE